MQRPSFGHENPHFMKTSLKRSSSFQTLLRVVFVRAVNPSPGLWDEDECQEVGVMNRRFLMGEYRARFLLLFAC
jgi:hypothetical protein